MLHGLAKIARNIAARRLCPTRPRLYKPLFPGHLPSIADERIARFDLAYRLQILREAGAEAAAPTGARRVRPRLVKPHSSPATDKRRMVDFCTRAANRFAAFAHRIAGLG